MYFSLKACESLSNGFLTIYLLVCLFEETVWWGSFIYISLLSPINGCGSQMDSIRSTCEGKGSFNKL